MVIQRTFERASAEAVNSLHAWLSRSPDFQSNVTVREPSPTHRALYATRDLPPSASILRIPSSHLISSNLAHRTPHVAAVLSAVEADNVQERLPDALGDSAAILLFLIAELAAGKDSRYHLWFQTLPIRFTNPFSVPKNVVDTLLAGTPLLPLIDTLRRELREMFDDWFLPYAVAKYPSHYPPNTCTWDTFVYVHSIIESRAFKIDNETMLVPFADMANHQPTSSPRRNAKARGWTVANSTAEAQRIADGVAVQKGLELHAIGSGVSEGDEVCISYGALPNWELLLHYGFALPGNPDDAVELALQVPEDDPPQLYMTKMLFLNMDMKPSIQVDHRLQQDDPLPVSLVASARLLLLDEEDAKNVSARNTDFSKLVSRRNEQLVCRQLRILLEQLLQQFGLSLSTLSGDDHESFRGFCQHYINMQQEIITKALNALELQERGLVER